MIRYKTSKEFDVEQIRDLFLSVNWASGKYPVILSIMVGIFISKIFVPMLPYPKYRSIAYA